MEEVQKPLPNVAQFIVPLIDSLSSTFTTLEDNLRRRWKHQQAGLANDQAVLVSRASSTCIRFVPLPLEQLPDPSSQPQAIVPLYQYATDRDTSFEELPPGGWSLLTAHPPTHLGGFLHLGPPVPVLPRRRRSTHMRISKVPLPTSRFSLSGLRFVGDDEDSSSPSEASEDGPGNGVPAVSSPEPGATEPEQEPTSSSSSSPKDKAPLSSGRKGEETTSESAAAGGGGAGLPSSGPVFMGQVFTMCDSTRRGMIAVNGAAGLVPMAQLDRLHPVLKRFFLKLADSCSFPLIDRSDSGPVFHFYFGREKAAEYVKQIHAERSASSELAQSIVGSCPLESAYLYFKEKPSLFRLIPDERQVRVARQLLRREKGRKAAAEFDGVPVFTARNLTIAMSTGTGIRWFTPYFFSKEQLDSLIGHSVDHYYRMLMHSRKLQRHTEAMQPQDSTTEVEPDDPDSVIDPPEVADFMEEMGQGGVPLEAALFRAAEVKVQDMADGAFLGNKWGRRLIGLQPAFPVMVDSFQRRAAVAEAAASSGSGLDGAAGAADKDAGQAEPRQSMGALEDTAGASGAGRPPPVAHGGTGAKEGGAEGLPERQEPRNGNGGDAAVSAATSTAEEKAGGEVGGGGGCEEERDGSGSGRGGGENAATSSDLGRSERAPRPSSSCDFAGWEPKSRANQGGEVGPKEDADNQPHLTWLGTSFYGSEQPSDAVVQRAMAQVVKDMEERVQKGRGPGEIPGPLFIADLGDPAGLWSVAGQAPGGPGWEEDDNE